MALESVPIDEGIEPVNKLLLRCKISSFFKYPNDDGRGPVNEQLLMNKTANSLSSEMNGDSVLGEKELLLRVSVWRNGSENSDEGND